MKGSQPSAAKIEEYLLYEEVRKDGSIPEFVLQYRASDLQKQQQDPTFVLEYTKVRNPRKTKQEQEERRRWMDERKVEASIVQLGLEIGINPLPPSTLARPAYVRPAPRQQSAPVRGRGGQYILPTAQAPLPSPSSAPVTTLPNIYDFSLPYQNRYTSKQQQPYHNPTSVGTKQMTQQISKFADVPQLYQPQTPPYPTASVNPSAGSSQNMVYQVPQHVYNHSRNTHPAGTSSYIWQQTSQASQPRHSQNTAYQVPQQLYHQLQAVQRSGFPAATHSYASQPQYQASSPGQCQNSPSEASRRNTAQNMAYFTPQQIHSQSQAGPPTSTAAETPSLAYQRSPQVSNPSVSPNITNRALQYAYGHTQATSRTPSPAATPSRSSQASRTHSSQKITSHSLQRGPSWNTLSTTSPAVKSSYAPKQVSQASKPAPYPWPRGRPATQGPSPASSPSACTKSAQASPSPLLPVLRADSPTTPSAGKPPDGTIMKMPFQVGGEQNSLNARSGLSCSTPAKRQRLSPLEPGNPTSKTDQPNYRTQAFLPRDPLIRKHPDIPVDIEEVVKSISSVYKIRSTNLPSCNVLKDPSLAAYLDTSSGVLRKDSPLYQYYGDTRLFSEAMWRYLAGYGPSQK